MEELKHECGVAMIRLLKPHEHYERKYGTSRYGLNKLYLMMEKQHNRGQEGAGIACVSMDAPAGTEYMLRERAEGKDAITEVFGNISKVHHPADDTDGGTAENVGGWEGAQLYMGHLRYSTTGKGGLQYVHPFLRRNNWRAKNLCLCGNFNMTNIDQVFRLLTSQGQSPRVYGDSYITLELMGHRLDREVERLYDIAIGQGLKGTDITSFIDRNVDMAGVLRTTMPHFDGGYVMCGLTGSGEMFAVRDPWGIRLAFYYRDDEVVAVASERAVLMTTFDLPADDIHELPAGHSLIVHRDGTCRIDQILTPQPTAACSFERIYFSRGSDRDIYTERKRLGELLIPAILQATDGDMANTVFSYIPNTAEVAFVGMTDGFRRLGFDVRIEKVVWKDIKLRTFIAEGAERDDLAAHVYDVTYGSLRSETDQLVIIDDSIVRGTTLKQSILKILGRLHPRKIVMVSSAPQIRYPDYYGIDMSHLEELCAFRAAIALIRERGLDRLLDEVHEACLTSPDSQCHVRRIYAPFSPSDISRKMAEMLRPEGMPTPIEIVFQNIEGLHKACPNHPGDWYFTGHYPTPGGIRMANRAYIDFYEKLPTHTV